MTRGQPEKVRPPYQSKGNDGRFKASTSAAQGNRTWLAMAAAQMLIESDERWTDVWMWGVRGGSFPCAALNASILYSHTCHFCAKPSACLCFP